jgi:hypothetical protein
VLAYEWLLAIDGDGIFCQLAIRFAGGGCEAGQH